MCGKFAIIMFLQVKEVDGDEVHLKFLKEDRLGTYRWPHVEDCSWEQFSHVKRILTNPIIVQKRGPVFQFKN